MRKFGLATLITLICLFLSSCGLIRFDFGDDSEQGIGCVTLYEHRDFEGDFRKICDSEAYLGDDFNDIVSSVRVDCNLRAVTLHEHRDFGGRYITLSGCEEINFVGDSLNDQISSVRLYRIE